jgi:predicted enzyme related to lactoylglutathione lyase
MITKIAFVGQPTRDLDRAKRFYSEALGLRHDHDPSERWSEFQTPDGKAICLDTYGPELLDAPTPYLALETDDLEAQLQQAEAGGARIVMPVQINKDPEGREICRMAVILDTEGNSIMLHQIAAWRA